MKASLVWRTLCVCGLLSATSLASHAAAITTAAQWDSAMTQYFGANYVPIKNQSYAGTEDILAWAGYQWLEGYVALAQSTGDAKYMATAKQIIDFAFTKRDDIRFASTTMTPGYWSAPTYYLYHSNPPTPAKGWRRLSNGYGTVGPLVDGRICESIILWCELARRGFPQYESAITGYLPKIKETLDMHLPSFKALTAAGNPVPAGNVYSYTLPTSAFKYWRDLSGGAPSSDAPLTWSGVTAVNHNATFARAMLGYDSLTGTTTYKANVQSVVNFYLNSLDSSRPSIAAWMYSPLDGNGGNLGKWEDVNHATVSLSLIEEAYRIGGYGITGAHVTRLVQTFHTFYNTATKDVDNFIDGSGAAQGSGPQTASIATKSWLWLSQFDPSIATKVRATYNQYFTTTNWSSVMSGWANLIYWDSLIAGTAAFDDTSIAASRPLYKDSVNLLKYPYYVQTTGSEVTGGAPEGTKQTQINYTITSATGSASALYQFSPVEDFLIWGGIRLTYKNTGAATWSLLVIDSSSNTMRIDLPTQAAYAPRTLRWSDFTNAAAVNKSTINKIRFQTVSSPLGSTGQFSFDDIKLVP